MRVLIIGGTGFIGPYAVRMLHEQGHELALFNRCRSETGIPGDIKRICGDRRELSEHRQAFKDFGPDAVLDMFPIGEEDAEAAMKVFRDLTERVIAVSSQDVYKAWGILIGSEEGELQELPLTEESRLRENYYPYKDKMPLGDRYDKILAERQVMNDPHIKGTVLRLPMVYGPGDQQRRLFPYLKRMDDGRPAVILDQNLANWKWTKCYVENAAAAVSMSVTDSNAAGRIYNVAEKNTASMLEWIEAIAEKAGWNGRIIAVPADKLSDKFKAGMRTEQDIIADSTRIRDELGFEEITGFDEGLKKTVEWERSHMPKEYPAEMFDYEAEDEVLRQLS